MSDPNSTVFGGRICADPELKYLPAGTAVAKITVANNSKYKDRETVTFLEATCWGKTAEIVSQYCKKGDRVVLEGELRTESWEDKQTGKKRSKMKLNVERVHMMGSANRAGDGQGQPERTSAPRTAPSRAAAATGEGRQGTLRPPPDLPNESAVQADEEMDIKEDEIPF